MEYTPFTIAQAEEIAEDFEDLKDTEFVHDGASWLVDAVAICPFPEADKQAFIDNFHETGDAATAMEGYSGDRFDVILLVCDAGNESKKAYLGIRPFVMEKGINYNFPVL